jgi:type II secretory pathway predicted ATPase ExeA
MIETSSASRSEIAVRIERALSARGRPLALVGRSGCGKTTLLRTALDRPGIEPRWTTARDLAHAMVDAIRRDTQAEGLAALAGEPRALIIEHLEDLRGRPRTLEELRRLLEARRHAGGAVF